MQQRAREDGAIIDGKAFAASLRARVTGQVTRLKREHGITPGLAVVLVGEHPASQVYVRNKNKQTKEAGMNSFEHCPSDSIDEAGLVALVEELNQDPKVNGILVQLPLPPQVSSQAIIGSIDPAKDVDGFHTTNVGLLAVGGDGLVPCTPLGCMMLIKDVLGDDLSGQRALVLGRSNIVGKPLAHRLLGENCTVTIAHSRTRDLPEECRRADILVAAVGRPRMVKGDWVKPGATVIDVGINRIETDDGKPRGVGDVEFAAARGHAGAITPVPGGVGPMTIACLLLNTLTAACRQHGVPVPEPDG